MSDQEAEQFLARWYAGGVAASAPARGREARAAVESGTVKISWRRDPAAPAGRPAPGTYTCTCGTASGPQPFGGPEWACAGCGRTWDGRGWLVAEPAPRTTEER